MYILASRRVSLWLVALLIATNWMWLQSWANSVADDFSRDKYHGIANYELRSTARDALLALTALSRELSRDQVIERTAQAVGDDEPFEKDGYWIVGWLNLKFSDSGRLISARSNFDPDIIFDEEEDSTH